MAKQTGHVILKWASYKKKKGNFVLNISYTGVNTNGYKNIARHVTTIYEYAHKSL